MVFLGFALQLVLKISNPIFKTLHIYLELVLQSNMFSVFCLLFLQSCFQILIIFPFQIPMSIEIYKVAACPISSILLIKANKKVSIDWMILSASAILSIFARIFSMDIPDSNGYADFRACNHHMATLNSTFSICMGNSVSPVRELSTSDITYNILWR